MRKLLIAGAWVAAAWLAGPAFGQECGGLLGVGCAKGQYCQFAPQAQCGAADRTGVCRAKPEACTLEYNPVCGCDGQTYGNACQAAMAGVSVAQQGECGAPPQSGKKPKKPKKPKG